MEEGIRVAVISDTHGMLRREVALVSRRRHSRVVCRELGLTS